MLPSEEIKNKINIVDLITEYLQLKKAGVNFRALCPFHQEKTPSFLVSPSKQIWHCFGCSLGGDIFEFVKQIEGVEFPEALQILASRAGVTLTRPTVQYQKEADEKKTLYAINELAAKFYAKVLADSQAAAPAREYLQKRGFKAETIQKWQLGFAPPDFHTFENFILKKGFQKREAVAAGLLIEKAEVLQQAQDGFFDRFRGRIMFPLFDIHGRVVGFTGRILKDEEGVAKYVNSPETLIYFKSHLLYGMHLAKNEIRRLNQAVIVEGNVDVITCQEAGFTNVVGSSGTALTTQQLELLKRFTENLAFAFDVDEAGWQAARRAVELALSLGFTIKIVSLPKTLAKDPDELIRKSPKLWEEQLKEAKNFLDFYFEAIFANLNLEESSEKKQAVSSFLPLLALLPDPIDRAHYVQKLALKIGVDQKIILELLTKILNSRSAVPPAPTTSRAYFTKKSKQELLERKVLGLFLKFAGNNKPDWEVLDKTDFTFPLLQEIFELTLPLLKNGKFSLETFAKEYPRLKAELELLIFAVENETSSTPDLSLEDLKKQFLTQLRFESLKQRMRNLSVRIQQAEKVGRFEEVKFLSSEFNNLTRELSKYHVA